MHGGREEHGAIATKTFRFIMDHFIDQDGHFVVATDREGNVIQPANPKSCNTTGYGTAFLAEGFFEYYRATRDPKALSVTNALQSVPPPLLLFPCPSSLLFLENVAPSPPPSPTANPARINAHIRTSDAFWRAAARAD